MYYVHLSSLWQSESSSSTTDYLVPATKMSSINSMDDEAELQKMVRFMSVIKIFIRFTRLIHSAIVNERS